MITLGKKYKDPLTGFTGIATSRTVYLNGCVHIALQGKATKDGKVPRPELFDEARLDPKTPATTGGPADHSPGLLHEDES